MAKGDTTFSLERFEYLCYARDRELAAREMRKLLTNLDARYGALDTITARLSGTSATSANTHLLTRITSALSSLFSDPQFHLSPSGFDQLILWHRWLAALFAASPFGNADHILRAMNIRGSSAELELNDASFVKFCLLYSPESEIAADVEVLWRFNRNLAAALFFALMSPRFLGTPDAHSKREALLGWLPQRLDEVDDIERLPLGVLHDVFMNCSYADRPDKHEIKRAIHRMVRRKVVEQGLHDLDVVAPRGVKNGKPVMMVVLEWFSQTHSIYRTHSRAVAGLRERFHVVGMGADAQVDAAGRAVFDEFLPLAGGLAATLKAVRAQAARRQPIIVFYPSIGMFPSTIYLANMRLAPIQVTALGHGASSMSPFIDYYAVDEDFAGDPDTFSEKLILLPKDGMPHVRSGAATAMTPQPREAPPTVRIAVASTTMKLNPRFMEALRRIGQTARTPVQFEFLIGFANGLVREQVRSFVHRYLPEARVYPHQAYRAYMDCIVACDLFLNPFPYGNMNGIADMAMAGLVGVCRTGPQIHERIDGAMFRRLDLPDWLIAKSDDEYVAAAVRLIDNPAERLELRRGMIARGGDQVFLEGRDGALGEALAAIAARPAPPAPARP
jgi:hypothetical protein